MDTKYAQYVAKGFLRKIPVPGKEDYYNDIQELVGSISFILGRKYSIAFEMIRETERMLINAISLFEMGYFDAAFYTLRQTLDICMLLAYFFELPDEEREKQFKDWKGSTAKFPGVGEMRRSLENADFSVNFKDFMIKMPSFFAEFKDTYSKLNKFTHKQGLRYFYSVRWRKGDRKDIEDALLRDFLIYLDKCIGCAFIFRLMVDPLPILRLDEEIEYRIPDSMAFPLSPRLIYRYIGTERLNEYKKTDLYSGFRESILETHEKMSEVTYTYVKCEHIDRKDLPEVFNQVHLLSLQQRVQLLLVARYPLIAEIVTYDGMCQCFTDVQLNNPYSSWSSEEYKALYTSTNWVNQAFKGNFATVVNIHNEYYILEHNEPFDPLCIIDLGNFAKELNDAITNGENDFKEMMQDNVHQNSK